MARGSLTKQEHQWFVQCLGDPKIRAEWLDEMQYTACAAILLYPKLTKECTAHLFSAPDQFYVEVYRALRAGQNTPQGVYAEVYRRIGVLSCAERIACLVCHPVTFWGGLDTIGRLKRFVAWQYRQQRKVTKGA